jgi:hypothetical protein
MEIRINIASLTPEQAFNLGTIIRDLPEKSSSQAVALIEPVETKAPKTRKRNPSNTKRFYYNTTVDLETVEYMVKLKKQGRSGLKIAEELNELNVPTPTGKKWSDATVWPVVYSRQAWKFWNNID